MLRSLSSVRNAGVIARVGGIDLNTPPIRAALAAVLALSAAPGGLHRRRPRPPRWEATGGQTGSTIRQAADDLRTLRGKDLIVKPGRSRRSQVPHQPPAPSPPCSPSVSRSPAHPGRCPQPRRGRKPAHWTAIDPDDETLRVGMQTLFLDLGITTSSAAASTTFVD
ncbi:MAG TPA: hypothetical protein VG276_20405, partial [Actinomycetes bacterium]|nr:hypothetical protein [Actinomycetes bacterium]